MQETQYKMLRKEGIGPAYGYSEQLYVRGDMKIVWMTKEEIDELRESLSRDVSQLGNMGNRGTPVVPKPVVVVPPPELTKKVHVVPPPIKPTPRMLALNKAREAAAAKKKASAEVEVKAVDELE